MCVCREKGEKKFQLLLLLKCITKSISNHITFAQLNKPYNHVPKASLQPRSKKDNCEIKFEKKKKLQSEIYSQNGEIQSQISRNKGTMWDIKPQLGDFYFEAFNVSVLLYLLHLQDNFSTIPQGCSLNLRFCTRIRNVWSLVGVLEVCKCLIPYQNTVQWWYHVLHWVSQWVSEILLTCAGTDTRLTLSVSCPLSPGFLSDTSRHISYLTSQATRDWSGYHSSWQATDICYALSRLAIRG